MKRLFISGLFLCFFVSMHSFTAKGQKFDSLTVEEATATLQPHTLKVHFIDVGGGLAALVQTPTGKHIFIDGGKEETDQLEEYLLQFLPKGSTLDLVIVTHADYDHFKGQMELFENGIYAYREFWYNGYNSSTLAGLANWPKYIDTLENYALTDPDFIFRYNLSDHYDEGDQIVIDPFNRHIAEDDVTITFMNLESNPEEEDPHSGRSFSESQRRNNASLVFKLEYGNSSFLFTGDINGKELHSADTTECDSEELELIQGHAAGQFDLRSTVFQSPHHGSNGSYSLPFLRAVKPEYVVIPAGNVHHHPTPQVQKRMMLVLPPEKIFRTDAGEDWGENTDEQEFDDSYIFECNMDSITGIYHVSYNEP